MLKKLDELTLTDPLTGALNRRGLQRVLAREVEWINRYGTSLLAVLLDLDNFKHINDTYGLAAGDTILKEVSRRLRNSMRPVDYVARIGGDEFIVLIAQTRLGDGFGVAEKIRSIISEKQCVNNAIVVNATASLGLVKVTEECSTVEELVRKCQYVLKQSKGLGKNRVSYTSCDKHSPPGSGMLEDIIAAMNQSQMYRIVKQPIFHLVDMAVSGYEFLTRFNVHMFEMPDDFFRLSRTNNMLTVVDRHCWHHCVQAQMHVQSGIRRHLNIYPTTLIETPVEEILKDLPVENRRDICVELSEELISTDPSQLLKSIETMRQAGVHIAMDDVGFGRSSLENLVILEPDIIKIDKKINIGLAKDKGLRRSLERILRVVRSLNAQVIVEGIEAEEDLKVIMSMGVKFGQGFFLGKPS